MLFRENVPLAPYTTFQIGGPARWFAEVASEADVVEAVAFGRERGLRVFILGGGSNLLVADQGYDGLVLHMVVKGVTEAPPGRHGAITFIAAAGENWDTFVSHTIARNCGGVECLAGIPGTVGGTPVQNVGAYGQEVSTTIRRVRAFDQHTNDFVDLNAADCAFSYRRSRFNTTARGRYIVTSVTFVLQACADPQLTYQDLKQYFQDSAVNPTLAETAAAVREIRHRKGMLLLEGESDCRSAGSFFKNPIVPEVALERIAKALALSSADIPHYAAAPGNSGQVQVKLPAAWLLEQAGFRKGFTLGRAGISTRHTLALTNKGGATANEILTLAARIVSKVDEQFGIHLEAEPMLLAPTQCQTISIAGNFTD